MVTTHDCKWLPYHQFMVKWRVVYYFCFTTIIFVPNLQHLTGVASLRGLCGGGEKRRPARRCIARRCNAVAVLEAHMTILR